MKQNRLISIGAFILVLALSGLMTGCMEKDVYDPNREKEPLPDPDKYFGFEMRSDVRLSVNYDIYGFIPLIEIYGENPMETVEGTPIKKEGIQGEQNRTEVHLPKHKATAYANQSLIGSNDDAYYIDRKGAYPFAIDIPMLGFTPVTERNRIDSQYPGFATWAKSMGNDCKDWYKK